MYFSIAMVMPSHCANALRISAIGSAICKGVAEYPTIGPLIDNISLRPFDTPSATYHVRVVDFRIGNWIDQFFVHLQGRRRLSRHDLKVLKVFRVTALRSLCHHMACKGQAKGIGYVW